MRQSFKRFFLRNIMNLWPPYLGAGICIKRISRDFQTVEVEMKLRFWNRNYVGTHFGGSLYAMTDPFLMLILIEKLGRDYIVWDKAAKIHFKKPGRGKVRATFHLSADQISSIRAQADSMPKVEPVFEVSVLDTDGAVVAKVEKTLYVKRKGK